MTKRSSVTKIFSSATWANSSLGTAQWHALPIDGELVQKNPVYFLSEDKKIFLPVLRFEFVLADVSESVNKLERFHSKNPVDIYILKHRIVGGWILTVFGSVSVRVQVVPCELFGSLTGGSPGVGWTLVTKSDAACSEFLAPDGTGCKQLAALLFYLRKVDCY